jgi:hypothetical protein
LMDHKECLYARVYAHVCLSFCVDAALTIAGNLAGCLFGQGRHVGAAWNDEPDGVWRLLADTP